MGVRKKYPKMSQVSHANDGFVWLSENVCVRLGNQPAQPARSKGLYDVDGLGPSQCLNQGRKTVLEVPVSLQWLRQEFRVSGSSADACTVGTWSEMRCNLSKITPVANVCDAFTALQHRSGRPTTRVGCGGSCLRCTGGRFCTALGSGFKESGGKMHSVTAPRLSVCCVTTSCRVVLCIRYLGDPSLFSYAI